MEPVVGEKINNLIPKISMGRYGVVIIVTTHTTEDSKVIKVLRLVRGNTVETRHVGIGVLASFRHLIGREVVDYTKSLSKNFYSSSSTMSQRSVGIRFLSISINRVGQRYFATERQQYLKTNDYI